jgi:hypothetical protein
MSDSTGPLSVAELKLVKNIVKQAYWPLNELESVFRAGVLRKCMDALRAPPEREAFVAQAVKEYCTVYKRRTKNDAFQEAEMQLRGKKRKETSSTGPRIRGEQPQARLVLLSDAPMSPARSGMENWNPIGTTPQYTAYEGTLSVRYDAEFPPPSPSHLDYPATFWDPTNIPPPSDGIKHIGKQKLDPTRLGHWQKQDRRGYTGQNEVMNGCSASSVAACAGIIPFEFDKVPSTNYGNSAWEWLHLVSFKMGGKDEIPQQPDNLVAGTYECNSLMISIEEAIKDLVLIDKLTLYVEVIATCKLGTHLGTKINYRVYYEKSSTEQIMFNCDFNPLVHVNPFSGDKDMFKKALRRHFGLPE